MKQINITIHPFSALAGMALLGLVLVTAGAMPLQGSSSTRDVSAIENVNDPHPRDGVRIVEGSPYTVPTGMLLVVTGLGKRIQAESDVEVTVDGATVLTIATNATCGGVHPIPFGLVAASGEVVSVRNLQFLNQGVLFGYLVDA